MQSHYGNVYASPGGIETTNFDTDTKLANSLVPSQTKSIPAAQHPPQSIQPIRVQEKPQASRRPRYRLYHEMQAALHPAVQTQEQLENLLEMLSPSKYGHN